MAASVCSTNQTSLDSGQNRNYQVSLQTLSNHKASLKHLTQFSFSCCWDFIPSSDVFECVSYYIVSFHARYDSNYAINVTESGWNPLQLFRNQGEGCWDAERLVTFGRCCGGTAFEEQCFCGLQSKTVCFQWSFSHFLAWGDKILKLRPNPCSLTTLTSTNCLASTRMFAGLETSLTTDVVLALVQYKGTTQG